MPGFDDYDYSSFGELPAPTVVKQPEPEKVQAPTVPQEVSRPETLRERVQSSRNSGVMRGVPFVQTPDYHVKHSIDLIPFGEDKLQREIQEVSNELRELYKELYATQVETIRDGARSLRLNEGDIVVNLHNGSYAVYSGGDFELNVPNTIQILLEVMDGG